MDVYSAFVAMYYILDAAYDETHDDGIGQRATEANPFLFKDIGSADPAVYIEFKAAWDARYGEDAEVSAEECKAFIKEYLAKLSPSCAMAFQMVVDDSMWKDDLKEIRRQASSRREYLSEQGVGNDLL
jgi:hypothetical protein